MWALIDNYDSFTYILNHYLRQLHTDCRVFKNDEISISELQQLNPERIILSPGPETPLQAGITLNVIQAFYTQTPILGVCLGHQAIGLHFGAKLRHAIRPMHGKQSQVTVTAHPLFQGINSVTTVMRYHSLVIDDLGNTGLQAIAMSDDTLEIMAIAHNQYPCIGIQFHPESIGTPAGFEILRNWNLMF